MYSTTVFGLVVLLVAAVHGIAISKSDEDPTKTAVSVKDGFALQSGYEGYLLKHEKPSSNWLVASKIGVLKNVLLPISSFLVVYGAKAIGVILHVVVALFLGVAATSAVCSLTPLCTISLNAPGFSFFKGQSVKDQVAELTRSYMTPENLDVVSRFVQSALDKYSVNQRRELEQPEPTVVQSVTATN